MGTSAHRAGRRSVCGEEARPCRTRARRLKWPDPTTQKSLRGKVHLSRYDMATQATKPWRSRCTKLSRFFKFSASTSRQLNSCFIAGVWHTPHGSGTGWQEQTPRCFKNLKPKFKYTSENEGPIETPEENVYLFSSHKNMWPPLKITLLFSWKLVSNLCHPGLSIWQQRSKLQFSFLVYCLQFEKDQATTNLIC